MWDKYFSPWPVSGLTEDPGFAHITETLQQVPSFLSTKLNTRIWPAASVCLQLCWKTRGLITVSSWYPEVAAGPCRCRGTWWVCITTMLQCIHVCGLYSSEELITTALCPCREQTAPCSHLSPRGSRRWLRNPIHPFLPPAMAASGAHPRPGAEPTGTFLWVGVPRAAVLVCSAALGVCRSKSICLGASYSKQSVELVRRKVKIDVTDVWGRVLPSSESCWLCE